MPNSARNARATAPAATRAVVSRADDRSSTLRTSLKPYLRAPARSARAGPLLAAGGAGRLALGRFDAAGPCLHELALHQLQRRRLTGPERERRRALVQQH